MLKVLVCSDSHGCADLLCSAVDFVHPDRVIHLGDIVEDSDYLSRHYFHIPVVQLKGNCDYGSDLPEEYLDVIETVPVFACHGHQFHVKYGLNNLYFAGQERRAKLCLYGHTHVHCCEEEKGITLFNPGACSGTVPRCALITFSSGCFTCSELCFGREGWYFL